MIEMATGLGLETVAEWVSDEASAAFLAETGVTYLQGFLYGHPAPVEELKEKGAL
jgi:EAL domain-containing protein (putative c-di-GMP-specific phosphodiesterase class I)